jgi:8-oxo-dGTP pyrophosphatase MutT (NUDIX family)
VTFEHVTRHGVTLEPAGNGVSRISWTDAVQHLDFGTAVGALQSLVDLAFTDLKQSRVEAWVDPDDQQAIRMATWAGLHREGVMRGVVDLDGERHDRILLARVVSDEPVAESNGFRALLNSFLPRKRAISQMLIRDHDGRVLMCQLTYKNDWDLPGGVVEVGESPQLAVAREVEEELGLQIEAGALLLTDWLPPWGGWDDALCLVFDGGAWDASIAHSLVLQAREIRSAEFFAIDELEARTADFTARRIAAALAALSGGGAPYSESGRPL